MRVLSKRYLKIIQACLLLLTNKRKRALFQASIKIAIFKIVVVSAFRNFVHQRKQKYMRIKLASILVDDQEKALNFYTTVLGFIKKTEIPMGEHKWLTVVAKDEQDGVELVLEPMAFEPARVYQKALFQAGIPLTAFNVDDVQKEYERLEKLGVVFSMKPTNMGVVTIAVLNDTCGNNIQIYQV